MGSGGSISDPSDHQNEKSVDYYSIEKLFKNGNLPEEDLSCALEEIIKRGYLDSLELILNAGKLRNARKLHPMHLAARHGKLEVLELLISAGFDFYSNNYKNQLPLHMCAFNKSSESALCATLLCIHGPRALKYRDVNGQTPLHIASKHNNVPVLRALLTNGGEVDISIPDKKGKSITDIATELKHHEILEEIKMKNSNLQKAAEPIDPARLMAVWERFFENAMKGLLDVEEDEMSGDDYFPPRYPDSDKSTASKSSKSVPKKNQKVNNTKESIQTRSKVIKEETFVDCYRNPYEDECDENDLSDWFSWIVFYAPAGLDEKYNNGGGYYYVMHKVYGNSRWLDEHLDSQRQLGLCSGEWEYDIMISKALPSTLSATMKDGWMTYYDPKTNQCLWMSIPTFQNELYLPLGNDIMLPYLSLVCHEDDSLWVLADQTCAFSWVVIFFDHSERKPLQEQVWNKWDKCWETIEKYDSKDDDNSDNYSEYYYYNRITGASTWDQPNNWDLVIVQNGGWTLCSNEADCSNMFWWHEDSGETAWAEEL